MTWIRFEDTFPEHPKVANLDDVAAAWLFVCGLGYANRHLTDGFLPERVVHQGCGSAIPIEDALAMAAQLVRAGLWERARGGFHIHDYLDYQPSREAVLERRKADAERKRRGRENRITESATRDGVQEDSDRNPSVPAHPDPAHADPSESQSLRDDESETDAQVLPLVGRIPDSWSHLPPAVTSRITDEDQLHLLNEVSKLADDGISGRDGEWINERYGDEPWIVNEACRRIIDRHREGRGGRIRRAGSLLHAVAAEVRGEGVR